MTLKSKIKTKLREGDEVIVLAGRDVGKTGNILKIAGKNKALVSGINMVKKHTKPNPQLGVTGGIEEKRITYRFIESIFLGILRRKIKKKKSFINLMKNLEKNKDISKYGKEGRLKNVNLER